VDTFWPQVRALWPQVELDTHVSEAHPGHNNVDSGRTRKGEQGQIVLGSQLCVFTWFCVASVCPTCPYLRRAWCWGGAAPGSAGVAAVASSPGRRGGGGPLPLRPPGPRRTGHHSDRRSPCRLYTREYNEVTNAKFVKGCIKFLEARSDSLQRTNTENLKQIIPEKELRAPSPNFHINVSVSDLYIPTIDLPILLQEKTWIDPGNI
jgi:hypothetical protein